MFLLRILLIYDEPLLSSHLHLFKGHLLVHQGWHLNGGSNHASKHALVEKFETKNKKQYVLNHDY